MAFSSSVRRSTPASLTEPPETTAHLLRRAMSSPPRRVPWFERFDVVYLYVVRWVVLG
jgi:hypothetical protein